MVPPAALYGLLNIVSATGIVFANKAVFSWHAFSFPYALTFVHTLVTYAGMQMFLRWGVFEGRQDILSKGEGVKVRILPLFFFSLLSRFSVAAVVSGWVGSASVACRIVSRLLARRRKLTTLRACCHPNDRQSCSAWRLRTWATSCSAI
jgi:hypothetical protein